MLLPTLFEARVTLGDKHDPLALSRDVLASLQAFAPLARVEREALLNAFVLARFADGAPVVEQGAVSDRFFIICAGTARVTAVGASGEAAVVKEKLGVGEYFGEAGLLNDEPRGATPATNPPVTRA